MATITSVAPPPPLVGEAAIAKVRALLPAFRSAMLVTHPIEGTDPHVRPMGLVGDPAAFGGGLWFFTDDRSRKVEEIVRHPRASVVLQNDDSSRYLHFTGHAAVVEDRARMRELYTPVLRDWFPDGLGDPHLALIRFDAERAEFWDSPGGLLQVLAAFNTAIVTDPAGPDGAQGTLEL
jgi:general stress protein 26